MDILTLSNIKLRLGQNENELIKIAEKKLGAKAEYFRIVKKSLDARDKKNIFYIYSIEFSVQKPNKIEKVIEKLPENKLQAPVVIVGSGPAGLFCALQLLKYGVRPMVIERGDKVEEREKKTKIFSEKHILDTESNIQFGEGGAGTFSDGKLNTQTHSGFNEQVGETFVRFGAPKEILWLNKPHIGSDNLKNVVKNMREYILSQGGSIEFNTKFTDIIVKNGKVVGVKIKKNGTEEMIDVSAVILAIGHSARDTFEMLSARGVFMKQKDFAVGVRIEHLQSEIGFCQYGAAYEKLPAADYKLVSHASDRAVFTFCMCPGGYVMASASEENSVVVNGMSNFARDGKNANSALIVQVSGKDFGSDSPLAGVEFQRKIERAAFIAGGRTYCAPVQLIGDFLKDRESSKFKSVLPTYSAGTTFAPMRAVLPKEITAAMKSSILDMDRRLKGFACPDGILTAVESRTSSPVRIERDENFEANIKGIYPCGEGAGYSGGITSSAADGIRVADALVMNLCKE